MSRCGRRLWWSAAISLLLACEGDPRAADWTVVYPDAASASREAALAVEIREGSCDASGGVRYFAEVRPTEAPPAPPVLEPGAYSLRAEARDMDCNVFVRGCTDVELPLDGAAAGVLLVPLSVEEPACDALSCMSGFCGPPPGVDAGPIDAGDGAIDTGVIDAGDADARPMDGGPGDWWDVSWARRQRLTFDNSGQAENLDDFPVLVVLDSSRVSYGAIQDTGRDLRFVSSDGATVLAHEIEDYDESGSSYIWVRVPRISSRSTTDFIWLYYDNDRAPAGENAAAVWTAGYAAVWHLNGGADDSTANGNDGVESATTGATGSVAGGRRFDGSASAIDVAADASIADIFGGGGTISAFIRPDGFGGVGFGRIIDKSLDRSAGGGWAWQLASGFSSLRSTRLERDFTTSNGTFNGPTGGVTLGAWQLVTLTYDDSSASSVPAMYFDDAAVTVSPGSTPSGSSVSEASVPLRIGGLPGETTRTFDGVIDEVRLSTRARSAAWIAAQHLSMTDALITFGAEERP